MSPWYALIRKYVSMGVKLYFREIRVIGAKNIPVEGPVMFTVNHQNAFLDALLVATTNQRHTHFLVRADVFKRSIVRMLFSTLNMMPVYRIRDGRHSLVNNHQIFTRCIQVLEKHHALMLFPEADHHQKRFLLPLSKGFTRIALGIKRPIKIIPVGINYTHHRSFGGSVSIYYGKPISTTAYNSSAAVDNRELRQMVNDQMQKIITIIPDNQYYQQYENYLNHHRYQYLDPVSCNQWIKQHHPPFIPDIPMNKEHVMLRSTVKVISAIPNFAPLLLCRLVLKKLNDPVFSSSVKLLTGIILLPIYYLIAGIVLYLITGPYITSSFLAVGILSLIIRKRTLPY